MVWDRLFKMWSIVPIAASLARGIVAHMREILPQDTNAALRSIAKAIPIHDIESPHIKKLIKEMKMLLSKEEFGVALAAPQVGESIQLFIVSGKALARDQIKGSPEADADDDKLPEVSDQVYINPQLIKVSRKKIEKHEGCLSIRGTWGMVPRAEKATIKAHDEHGKKITRGASGFLAHVFQHETDHLNGILYIDKATKLYEEKEEARS
jgi:peptide deformylase